MVFRNEDKEILKNNSAATVCKLSVVGTDIVLTEDDYIADWKYEDYRYVPENGFIGQFVERLLDGNFKNLPTDLILENKEINLQLGVVNMQNGGEPYYYDYGNFLITNIGETDTSGQTSFQSADYTKKFNVVYDDNIEYPCIALELANKACEQAGVELYTDGIAYVIPISKGLNIFEGQDEPSGILQAGNYCFNLNNKYYNFTTNVNLKLYDCLTYIGKDDVIVQRYITEDFNVVKTNITFEISDTYQSDYTLLVGRETKYVDFTNNDFVIDSNQFDSNDTLRTVMQSIGKLAYSWVRTGIDNKIHIDFSVKNESDVDAYNTIDSNEYYESTKQDIEYGPINKVLLGESDIEGERIYKTTEDYTEENEHVLNIFDNPLVYTEDLKRIAIDECDKLFGLRYTPLNIKSIGHPWLEGDDYVRLDNIDGETLYTYPFDRTIEYKGYITTNLSSQAETAIESEYSYEDSAIQIAKRTKLIVDKDKQTITQLVEKTDDQETRITNVETNVEGITDSVKKIQNDYNTNMVITNISSGYPVTINDAGPYNAESIVIHGKSIQASEPSVDNPVEIQYLSGIKGIINVYSTFNELNLLLTENNNMLMTESGDSLSIANNLEHILSYRFPYRLCSIGEVSDTLDVIKGTYIKRIEYIDNYNGEELPEHVYRLDESTGIKYCNALSMSTTGQFSNGASVYYVTGSEEVIDLSLGTLQLLDGYNKITIDTNIEPDIIDVVYLTDSPLNGVYATQTDLKRTSENVIISVISTIDKNGVSKVKTETDFTFDKDGLNISKEGADTSTQITEDGMIIYSNTGSSKEEMLTVHSTGVNAENVSVRTYLTIGTHSRVQDYNDGTGIFFIG